MIDEDERVRRALERGRRLHGQPYAVDTPAAGPCELCSHPGMRELDHCHRHKTSRGFICRSCNASMKAIDAALYSRSWTPPLDLDQLVYAARCRGCKERVIGRIRIESERVVRNDLAMELRGWLDR